MGLEIFLPSLNDRPGTAKDYVVSSLFVEKRLSLREIQKKINEEYQYAVSYQAVRKATLQLLELGVLKESVKKYSINEVWIERISRFCNSYKHRSERPSATHILDKINNGEGPQVLAFNSMFERREFEEELENDVLPFLKEKKVTIQIPYATRGFNHEKVKERMDLFKKYAVQLYLVYKYKNCLNKFACENYLRCGANAKVGIDYGDDSWIIVYDDLVFQTIFPQDLKIKGDRIGQRNVSQEIMEFLENYFYKKIKLKVILQRNTPFAKSIRKNIFAICNRE